MRVHECGRCGRILQILAGQAEPDFCCGVLMDVTPAHEFGYSSMVQAVALVVAMQADILRARGMEPRVVLIYGYGVIPDLGRANICGLPVARLPVPAGRRESPMPLVEVAGVIQP